MLSNYHIIKSEHKHVQFLFWHEGEVESSYSALKLLKSFGKHQPNVPLGFYQEWNKDSLQSSQEQQYVHN